MQFIIKEELVDDFNYPVIWCRMISKYQLHQRA